MRGGNVEVRRYLATLVVAPVGSHIDIVYWTLTVEISFYLMVAVGLGFFGFSSVVRFLLLIGVVSVAFNAVALSAQQTVSSGVYLDMVRKFTGMHTTRLLLLRHGCYFALGVLLWKRAVYGLTNFDRAIFLVLMLGSVFEILFTVGIHRAQFPMEIFSSFWIVFSWFLSYLVIDLVMRSEVNEIFSKFRMGPAFRILGLLTFPVYLLHNEAGLFLKNLVLINTGCSDFMAALIAMAGVIFVAWFVCFSIEPVVKFYSRRLLDSLLRYVGLLIRVD